MPEKLITSEKIAESLSHYIKLLCEIEESSVCAMIGPRFEFYNAEKSAYVFSFSTDPWTNNTRNVVHGGITATMLDTAMGVLTFCLAGNRITQTVSLNISYLRPVTLGDRFFVAVRTSKCGRTIINAVAEAWMENCPDKLVATAGGIYHVG